MDFHSLSRRELQTLCKKNKIPANMTNVAMVDALAALPEVEGIEEFLNSQESEVRESPKRKEMICSEIPRTALRTSTRRKAIKEETGSSKPMTRTRRGTGSRCAEEPDQENKDLNAVFTPALPSGRRRTVAASACKKVDFLMNEINLDKEKNEIPETPAVPTSQKRVAASSDRTETKTRNNATTEKRAYSTRRSMRLLEKNMEDLNLMEDRSTEPINVQLSFEEMTESTGPEKEAETEIESKKAEDSEGKADAIWNVSTEENYMDSEVDNQEKHQTKSEDKNLNAEPERDLDVLTDSAVKLSSKKSYNDDNFKDVNGYETVAPDEGTEEASKENSTEVSAEELENVDEESAMNVDGQTKYIDESESPIGEHFAEKREASNPDAEGDKNDLQVVSVDDALIENVEASLAEVEDGQSDIYESESKIGEISDVKEEELVDGKEGDKKGFEMALYFCDNGNLPSSLTEEPTAEISGFVSDNLAEFLMDESDTLVNVSVTEVEDDQNDIYKSESKIRENYDHVKEEELVDGMEGDKKGFKMVLDQAEVVTLEDKETCDNGNLPSSLIEKPTAEISGFVSENLTEFLMDESDTLVDVSVTLTEEIPISSIVGGISLGPFPADLLAGQFPRPTVISLAKEQTTKLPLDVSDGEEENVQEKMVDNKDVSLRQLRKMFKERLQLTTKKMDVTNKDGKVRTALQQLPGNRMENRS